MQKTLRELRAELRSRRNERIAKIKSEVPALFNGIMDVAVAPFVSRNNREDCDTGEFTAYTTEGRRLLGFQMCYADIGK